MTPVGVVCMVWPSPTNPPAPFRVLDDNVFEFETGTDQKLNAEDPYVWYHRKDRCLSMLSSKILLEDLPKVSPVWLSCIQKTAFIGNCPSTLYL